MKRSINKAQTILVVDDSEDIRELLRLQVSMLGYRVLEASNGQEAVDIARKECPALILMDITMPILDGLSATRVIRAINEACGIVIIAFSGLHGQYARELALDAGCDDFIQKPVEFSYLSELIHQRLPAAR